MVLPPSNSYSVYFAGELFSIKHLFGNALLAREIEKKSSGIYRCIVPQNLEQRETTATAIRNQDILQVVSCDLGLFHFDGPELDSGTVVEYMIAKMLDIPSVIMRTDFRDGGDTQSVPWNLMAHGYPRTKVIVYDCMVPYQGAMRKRGFSPTEAGQVVIEEIAQMVIEGFESVRAERPVISPEMREKLYLWVREFVGSGFDKVLTQDQALALVESKMSRGLL